MKTLALALVLAAIGAAPALATVTVPHGYTAQTGARQLCGDWHRKRHQHRHDQH